MATDEHGNLTSWPTFHDVIRSLIRGRWPNTEFNQQRALMAIDAHEQGLDTGAWAEELRRRAEVAAPVAPRNDTETVEEKIARLEAQLARAQAVVAAQAGPAASESLPLSGPIPESEPSSQSAPSTGSE